METESVECRECGTPFNLAAQWYYDNLCPSCKSDEEGEEKTWPACPNCDDRIEPGTGTTAVVVNPSAREGKEGVYVCSDECKSDMERARP